jgi:DNA modification methylase
MNRLIKGFKETRRDDIRYVRCGLCKSLERTSIVPHMKQKHPREWLDWLDCFKRLRSKGASFKEIMWEFNRLFSWTVVKRELALSDPMLHNHQKVKEFIPKDFHLEDSTVWAFSNRGDWANHTRDYPGNWTPHVPRNLILRYSEPKDTVLDAFVGGGTTLIECLLLQRNGIGVDINPVAVEITQRRIRGLRHEAAKKGFRLHRARVNAVVGDARKLSFLKSGSVDFICTHPPYLNQITYTQSQFDDLSRIRSPREFLDQFRRVATEFRRVLKPNHYCAIMIGDARQENRLIPLGFRVLDIFEREQFLTEQIFIKKELRASTDQFYRNKLDYPRIAHEYVLVFRRPAAEV